MVFNLLLKVWFKNKWMKIKLKSILKLKKLMMKKRNGFKKERIFMIQSMNG